MKKTEQKNIEEEKKESSPSLDKMQKFRDNMKGFRMKAKEIIGEAAEKNKEDLTPASKESVEKVIKDLEFKKDNKILDARSVEVKPFYFIKHVKGDRENLREKNKLDKRALVDKPLDKKEKKKKENLKEFMMRKHKRFLAYRRLMRMRRTKQDKKNGLINMVKMVRLAFVKPKKEVQNQQQQQKQKTQQKQPVRVPLPGPSRQGR